MSGEDDEGPSCDRCGARPVEGMTGSVCDTCLGELARGLRGVDLAPWPATLRRIFRRAVPAPDPLFPVAPIPSGVPRGFDFLDPVEEGSALRMPRGPVERRRGRVRLVQWSGHLADGCPVGGMVEPGPGETDVEAIGRALEEAERSTREAPWAPDLASSPAPVPRARRFELLERAERLARGCAEGCACERCDPDPSDDR